jgi:hypothetical protein
MSAIGNLADIDLCAAHVCKADISSDEASLLLCPNLILESDTASRKNALKFFVDDIRQLARI